MTRQLLLRCRCGALRGVATEISPTTGSHLVCYCDDCQVFAQWLGSHVPLDAHGGTEVYQLSPSQLSLTDGIDQLACVRLSSNGLHRFYTRCCRSHVGNAVSAKVPFIGMSSGFIEPFGDAEERRATLGEIGYIQGRFARGGRPPHAPNRATSGLLWKSARLLLGWLVTGKGKPSPFFDAKTGRARVEPQILGPETRLLLLASLRAMAPR